MLEEIGLFLAKRHVLVLMTLGILFVATAAWAGERPVNWALPMEMAGAPNLHRVEEGLYRSAQPSAKGMRNLEKMGVRTVLNLRAFHWDDDEMEGTGLAGENIRMKTWHPRKEEAVRFLKIATDPARRPLLVHCQHGADRTGTMIALYRIAVQGWTKEEAIREMVDGGYGFHGIWSNLPTWIRDLDIDAIKREAGLGGNAP